MNIVDIVIIVALLVWAGLFLGAGFNKENNGISRTVAFSVTLTSLAAAARIIALHGWAS